MTAESAARAARHLTELDAHYDVHRAAVHERAQAARLTADAAARTPAPGSDSAHSSDRFDKE